MAEIGQSTGLGIGSQLKILSDLMCAQNTGDCANQYTGLSGVLTKDHYISVTFNALSNTTGFFRSYIRSDTNLNTGYVLKVTKAVTNNIMLFSVGQAILGMFTQALSLGDVLTVYAIGTSVGVLYNGTSIITATDSTFASGIQLLRMTVATSTITNSVAQVVMGNVSQGGGGGIGAGTLLGSSIVDLDSNGFPIAEMQIGTNS